MVHDEYDEEVDFEDSTELGSDNSKDSIESAQWLPTTTIYYVQAQQGTQRPNRDVNRIWVRREDRLKNEQKVFLVA